MIPAYEVAVTKKERAHDQLVQKSIRIMGKRRK
jgi:hypothetical protein